MAIVSPMTGFYDLSDNHFKEAIALAWYWIKYLIEAVQYRNY